MTRSERRVNLRLTCQAPPAHDSGTGLEFGLQDKDGQLTPGIVEPNGSERFEADLRAETGLDGSVRLLGPFVHGPPSGRFLHLSCRAAAPGPHAWIFRLKVPLTGIADQLGARAGDSDEAIRFEARVRASGGGTVPLLDTGWLRLSRTAARSLCKTPRRAHAGR